MQAAGKAILGKGISEAFKQRGSRAEALNNAIMTDPAAVAEIEKQRSRQKRNFLIAGVAAVAVAGASVGYVATQAREGLNQLWHNFSAGTPKPEMSIDIQSVLNKIELPAKPIALVQGDGTSSAKIHTKTELGWPVAGQIFNATLANLTNQTASVERDDSIQMIMPGNAVELKAKPIAQLVDGKAQTVWGVEAVVDVDSFGIQLVNPHTATDSKGNPIVKSHNGPLTSAMGIVGVNDGTGRNVDSIEQIADNNFVNSCEQLLPPTATAGIQNYVSALLTNEIDLISSLPAKDQGSLPLLQSIAQQPVGVTFQESTVSQHNRVKTGLVDYNAINLPTYFVPNNTELAHALGLSPDQVQVNDSAGQCNASPEAVNDILQFNGHNG